MSDSWKERTEFHIFNNENQLPHRSDKMQPDWGKHSRNFSPYSHWCCSPPGCIRCWRCASADADTVTQQDPSAQGSLERLLLSVWVYELSPHLGGELLLAIHQALNVRRVVAAALAGGDGAFASCAGDLGGDGGGGGQRACAHAGGQTLAQGLGGRSGSHWSLSQLLSQQKEVAGLLHLLMWGLFLNNR